MTWTDARKEELRREYSRIGYADGERWPFPDPEPTPEQYLALLRSVLDGSGLAGYLEALRHWKDRPRT